MANQVTPSNERSRTFWTPTMERYFIDLLLDQVHKGNRVGYTFTKQAWTDMLTIFNAKFGSKYDKDVLKGRYKNLWEQHNDVKILLEQSGFAWNETRQMVIAADHVWDSYVKAHPDMRSYKTKPILNYNDLCVIYGYATADGRYSRSSHDIDLEDDAARMKIGKGSCFHNLNNEDRNRTNWSPTMDRYFVDLMLEQVHKGTKIENTFNKLAWTEMISYFNEKLESNYNKNVLRSRYKILRKHYNDMKYLLGQSGFDLDELRQMVVADDCVWDAYIKAHPDARSFRTTLVPDYNDLCMIYGDEIAEGRKNSSIQKSDNENYVMRIGEQKGSRNLISCERLRTNWTPPMDRYFIDLMLDQLIKGNKIDNTFISQAWIDITTLFNSKFGSQHNKEVLKNRYKSLRKQYTDIKILLEQNGFTWDETRQMVRADDNIWDAYIKAHPDARSYRVRIVPNYDDLCLIFGSFTATGRNSCQDYVTNYGDEVLEISFEGLVDQDVPTCNNSGSYWTPEIDRYFVDLMLHHVHKGHKIDPTCRNEAWTDIITSFNAEFGSEYEEGVLRQHYKKLWKQFNDINNLLGQGGFSWDETRQMIIADDYICGTYVQEHPDTLSYINRTLSDYNDLCIIFRNAPFDGGSSSENYADVNKDVIRLSNGEEIGDQTFLSDGSRTYWTPTMDQYFMDLMLEQVNIGNRIDKSFNEQAWTDMITLFTAKFGSRHDKDVLRSRCKSLRKQYIEIKNLLPEKGFTLDNTKQMVTAEDDARDAYLEAHPDSQSHRTKAVLDYKKLCMIYENTNSNGKASQLGENADTEDDILPRNTVVEGKTRETLATCDQSRTYWTPPMDRYFIELMLEQVHIGNKIGNTFHKQAWELMLTCFNSKFDSRYDKDILRNRFKNLRKHYNYVKVLLNHNGFVWHDNRQMVTASDDVWEAYIQEHPDAQSYRTKILADYRDLCMIYDGDLVKDVKETMPHSCTKKRPSMTQLKCQTQRKLHRNDSHSVKDAICEMAAVVTTLKNQQKEENEKSISIENVMCELQAIPDIDEDLILDACDLLEDEIKAKTFLALDVKIRKKWLLRKLRR